MDAQCFVLGRERCLAGAESCDGGRFRAYPPVFNRKGGLDDKRLPLLVLLLQVSIAEAKAAGGALKGYKPCVFVNRSRLQIKIKMQERTKTMNGTHPSRQSAEQQQQPPQNRDLTLSIPSSPNRDHFRISSVYVDSHATQNSNQHTQPTTSQKKKHQNPKKSTLKERVYSRFTQPSSDDVPIRNVVEYDVPSPTPRSPPIHRSQPPAKGEGNQASKREKKKRPTESI